MGTDDTNPRLRTGVFHCNPLCPRKIGGHYLIYGHADTSFPLQAMVGPDWPCMLVTYCLILGGSGAVSFFVISATSLGMVAQAMQVGLTGEGEEGGAISSNCRGERRGK